MAEYQGTGTTLQDEKETPLGKTDDQGALQEKKDDELEDITDKEFTPNVQKRINQLTKKYRESERKLTEVLSKKDSDKAAIDSMREHNRQLYEAMQNMTKATETLVDVTVDKKDQDSFDMDIKGLGDKLVSLKAARVQAMKDLDAEKMSFIEDQMDSIKEQLFEKKQAYKQKKEDAKPDKQKQDNAPDVAIKSWVEKTEWFEAVVNGEPNQYFNPAMAEAARAYDTYLLGQEKWKNIPISERLDEVKKKIEEKFKYKKVEGKKPPTVEGGGEPAPSAASTHLTEEMKHVAHRIFEDKSPQEAEKIYAEQLGFIEKGRK
jgi:hypothetical protein